jgi:site-specific recombinase XerD
VPIDLAELLPHWRVHLRAERKSPGTVTSYSTGVELFLRWCADTGREPVLDRATVSAWVADLLDRGAEPATARSRQLALRRFSAWLVGDGTVPVDPLLGIRAPKLDAKVVEPLTDAELKALLRACSGGDFRDHRDTAVIRFMFETGARAGETAAMLLPDMHWQDGYAIVRRGKGGKGRSVPFGRVSAFCLVNVVVDDDAPDVVLCTRWRELHADPAVGVAPRIHQRRHVAPHGRGQLVSG